MPAPTRNTCKLWQQDAFDPDAGECARLMDDPAWCSFCTGTEKKRAAEQQLADKWASDTWTLHGTADT